MPRSRRTAHSLWPVLDPVDALIMDEAPEPAGRVLVVDAPALASAAAARGWDVIGYADSLLDEWALTVPVVAELTPATLAGVDLGLMRLPKAVAALTEYAQLLARVPGVRLVAGGRVKHMTRSMNDALATRFTRVRASLGRQKSRVLHAAGPTPGPVEFPRSQRHAELGITLAAHGATFAGTRIDPGTRLLLGVLDQLPEGPVVDLGSGNGTLAVLLAAQGRDVIAVDESRAAVQATAASARLNDVVLEVRRDDGLTGFADGELGLVVCNPPFHTGTAKDSTPALAMIDDAARVLRPGAELWLVWNSHLPYLQHLRNTIGRTSIVARNPKFTVTRSVRRGQ